jgi:hypothetical protein
LFRWRKLGAGGGREGGRGDRGSGSIRRSVERAGREKIAATREGVRRGMCRIRDVRVAGRGGGDVRVG